MRRTPPHPINPWIRNGVVVDFYLNLVRKKRFHTLRRVIEHILGTEINGSIPTRLHVPHPYGVLVGSPSKIGEDVTLMQFTLLGPKDPWYNSETFGDHYPRLEEGVYVSAGAKVLGPITVGAWTVIGANAVVTEDVPPFSTVFGQNRILRSTDGGPPQLKKYLESRKQRSPS